MRSSLHISVWFPMNPVRRQEWIEIITNNRVPSERSLLCSMHFGKECFMMTTDKVRLKETAVPTLQIDRLKYMKTEYMDVKLEPTSASIPANVVVEHQPSTSLMNDHIYAKSNNPELIIKSPLVIQSTVDTSTSSEPFTLKIEDTSNGVCLKRKIMELAQLDVVKSKKIKFLQQANWRYRKQIKSLKHIITQLKTKVKQLR